MPVILHEYHGIYTERRYSTIIYLFYKNNKHCIKEKESVSSFPTHPKQRKPAQRGGGNATANPINIIAKSTRPSNSKFLNQIWMCLKRLWENLTRSAQRATPTLIVSCHTMYSAIFKGRHLQIDIIMIQNRKFTYNTCDPSCFAIMIWIRKYMWILTWNLVSHIVCTCASLVNVSTILELKLRNHFGVMLPGTVITIIQQERPLNYVLVFLRRSSVWARGREVHLVRTLLANRFLVCIEGPSSRKSSPNNDGVSTCPTCVGTILCK